jgi:hypothetical protein
MIQQRTTHKACFLKACVWSVCVYVCGHFQALRSLVGRQALFRLHRQTHESITQHVHSTWMESIHCKFSIVNKVKKLITAHVHSILLAFLASLEYIWTEDTVTVTMTVTHRGVVVSCPCLTHVAGLFIAFVVVCNSGWSLHQSVTHYCGVFPHQLPGKRVNKSRKARKPRLLSATVMLSAAAGDGHAAWAREEQPLPPHDWAVCNERCRSSCGSERPFLIILYSVVVCRHHILFCDLPALNWAYKCVLISVI